MKIFNIKYLILSLVLCSLFVVVVPVLADKSPNPTLGTDITNQMDIAGAQSGLSARDPRLTVTRSINYFLGLLATIFVAYTVYAGYLWMTAGGEEEKIGLAKKHLMNAIIGLGIVLAAFGITLLVTTYLIRATTTSVYYPPVFPSY